MSEKVELVLVKLSDLVALQAAVSILEHAASDEGCEGGDFVGQSEHLAVLKQRSECLRFKPVTECLRRVEPSYEDSNDPAMVILPPDVDTARAVELVNSAIQHAASFTGDGQGLNYFEGLQDELGKSGLIITQAIDLLECQSWDQSNNPEEPHKVAIDDPEWVQVRVSGSAYIDDGDLTMELADGSVVDFAEGEHQFIGYVGNLTYTYPRSDRYGVPEEATDRGARKFVVNELGFACSRDFEVYCCDSRDDSSATFSADCIIPREILVPIQRPVDADRDQS